MRPNNSWARSSSSPLREDAARWRGFSSPAGPGGRRVRPAGRAPSPRRRTARPRRRVAGDRPAPGRPGARRARPAPVPVAARLRRGCDRTPPGVGRLRTAVRDSRADVVVTTGSTAAGPVDFLHDVLREAGARLLVDSVAVRPGHPMLLAELPPTTDGRSRRLVGLPGNPLAAVAGAVTLAAPLLRRLGGHPDPEPLRTVAAEALPGHPRDTRLLPVPRRADLEAPDLRGRQRGVGRRVLSTGPARVQNLPAYESAHGRVRRRTHGWTQAWTHGWTHGSMPRPADGAGGIHRICPVRAFRSPW
ncbi:molybdopterin-binding protein [Streptomyces sp. NPDC127061]|uniref:molybdopterin-binding protein n=1 Tax=Streptomyces sp. NPDC127061 TaxID=3347122 RepID=UPI003655B4D8